MQGSARKDVVFGAAGVYPVTVPGPKWKSWFDAAAQTFIRSDIPDQILSQYTVDLWVQATELGQLQFSAVINNFNNPDQGQPPDSFQIDTDGENPGNYRIVFESVTDGLIFGPVTTEWQHLAVTSDGAILRTYVNGAFKNSKALPPSSAGTNFRDLVLGRNRAANVFFTGKVDEVEIFDRALSEEEIRAIFSAGSAGKCKPSRITVVPGVNAATFVHDPTVGGLGSFFGTFPDVPLILAVGIPLPLQLGPVKVEFFPAKGSVSGAVNGRKTQAGGVLAPLLFVISSQINLQIPWEVDTTQGPVTVVVTVDGVSSDPIEAPLSPAAPGIFTFDFGPGRAAAFNNADGTVAQPVGSLAGGTIGTKPVAAGDVLVILATGLGPVTPDAETGEDSLDEQGGFVRRDTTFQPSVFIGGVEAEVLFSGLSPQFVGVNQVNVFVPEGVEPSDTVSLVIEVDGTRSREDVTIAVSP